jgi:hypothetical protein
MSDDLHALQKRFQDYLIGTSEAFEKDIVSTSEALAEHRLGAYYNAYRIRLIDCLANDFSGLHKTLGEEAFEYMVLDYLQLYPSNHPSVRWVGKHMVEFLRHSEYENREFLAELASFEWTQGLCFDAAGSDQIFTLENMASISPESWPHMTFQFQPSVQWLDLHWNVPSYWVAVDNNETPPPKQREEIPTRWLMWRKVMSPNWRSLDVAEAWSIEAAINGANFAELCEGLLEWFGDESVAVTAASYLKQWLHDETIVDIHIE